MPQALTVGLLGALGLAVMLLVLAAVPVEAASGRRTRLIADYRPHLSAVGASAVLGIAVVLLLGSMK
jgi:hypothetical protein